MTKKGCIASHLIHASKLRPTRVPQPKWRLDRFSRFAWLTTVTDRQTDRQTDHPARSVTVGRMYIRSADMRPNNKQTPTPSQTSNYKI